MIKSQATYDPYEHAAQLGIAVSPGRLHAKNALWVPDARTILVKRGLPSFHERVALTHELGHATLGHRSSTPRTELQADRFAARKLIDHELLLDVMRTTPDTGVWCLELGVTHRILDLYLRENRIA